eukprot:s2564_g30.t1
MDFEDFLIEYDLTEAQLQLAKKLKAEANFRQLLNVLGDHALFFSRQYPAFKRQRLEKEGRRSEVLGWFASLSVEERLAVLSCNEEGWVQAVLKMNRHVTAGGAQRQGHFKVTLKPSAPNSRRQGGTSATRPNREVKVHYRRPHRLPDGEVLAPPATTAFRQAATRLSRHLRVELRSTSVAIDWGAIVPSPGLLSDSQAFIGLMDEISLGRFLQEEPGKAQSTPWAEASWLGQWGSHFPLAAFLASRLEVLLFQGYASRLQDPVRPPILPLAEVWASMPQQQREMSWARLGRCLLRRLLSETLASAFHDAGTTVCHSSKKSTDPLPGKQHGRTVQAKPCPVHEQIQSGHSLFDFVNLEFEREGATFVQEGLSHELLQLLQDVKLVGRPVTQHNPGRAHLGVCQQTLPQFFAHLRRRFNLRLAEDALSAFQWRQFHKFLGDRSLYNMFHTYEVFLCVGGSRWLQLIGYWPARDRTERVGVVKSKAWTPSEIIIKRSILHVAKFAARAGLPCGSPPEDNHTGRRCW